jgi:hypothetical protein
MEGIKDSNFVNFANSINEIHRRLTTPKKRGVREGNIGGEAELEVNLRNDMISIITSPLSQLGKLEPVAGLSAAQIEALRAVYAWVREGLCLDEGFEAVLEAAVGLLNPNFTPRGSEGVAEDQGDSGDSMTGTSSRQGRIYTIFINNIPRRAVYAGAQKHTISSATSDLV